MKNLITHLQESLRIGINDKPENNIDEFMGSRCLYAIYFDNPHLSSLRNNEKFSFNIFDIEDWSKIDEEQLSINIRKGNSLINHDGLSNLNMKYYEEYNALIWRGKDIVLLFISQEDKDKLSLLYKFIENIPYIPSKMTPIKLFDYLGIDSNKFSNEPIMSETFPFIMDDRDLKNFKDYLAKNI